MRRAGRSDNRSKLANKKGRRQRTPSLHKKGFAPLIAFGLIVAVAIGIIFVTQFAIKPASGQELKTFQSCDQIKQFLEENSGSAGGYLGGFGGSMMETTAMRNGALPPMAEGGEKQAATDSSAGTGSPDYSSTNVQVEGVDEPDIVKNDGKYIYTVSGSQIFIIDAYPAEGAQLLSTINSTGVSQIFVNGDRLVVFGNDYSSPDEPVIQKIGIAMPRYYPSYSEKTYIHVYDITDRSNPAVLNEFSIDGYYSDARMIGDYVYLIANKGVS